MRRRNDDGFTLIEILIAMLILAVGLVGILALFPAGLKSDQASLQDTYTATIGESVYNSLLAGFREAPWANQIRFTHDYRNPATGRVGRENWPLPSPGNSYTWKPQNNYWLPTGNGCYRMGKDTITAATLQDLRAQRNDYSDPLDRYGFAVGIRQIASSPGLFDIRILVYTQGGAGIDSTDPQVQFTDKWNVRWTLVQELRGRIARN